MQHKRRIRQRANRYGFTINNPFITDCVKVLEPNNLTTEQQELLKNDKHEYSHLKTPENEKYFDFAITEYTVNEIKDNPETAKVIVAERIFFKNYAMAKAYFKTIPFIDYFFFNTKKAKTRAICIYKVICTLTDQWICQLCINSFQQATLTLATVLTKIV